MQDIKTSDDLGAGELCSDDEERDPRADHRDREHDRVRDAQACAGEEVVGQGVAREALDHAKCQQRYADEPVQLTRLAERAGEEDPEHVDRHGGDEQQCRPVVDLAHDQPTAHVERDVQRGGVCPRHLDATQRRVAALVLDFAHRRVEEERQVGAGEQQHDERVKRDLAHHERPVVWEDLVQLLADATSDAEPVLERLAALAENGAWLLELRGGWGGGHDRDRLVSCSVLIGAPSRRARSTRDTGQPQ
jgi:hypothetical protein